MNSGRRCSKLSRKSCGSEHRLPPAPPPGSRAVHMDRPGQRPTRRARWTRANRGILGIRDSRIGAPAPGAPANTRPWTRPGGAATAAADRKQRPAPRMNRRIARSATSDKQKRRLDSPFVRPQPKPELQREFRKVTLTEGADSEGTSRKTGCPDKGHAERS